jgi:hypothetical protein
MVRVGSTFNLPQTAHVEAPLCSTPKPSFSSVFGCSLIADKPKQADKTTVFILILVIYTCTWWVLHPSSILLLWKEEVPFELELIGQMQPMLAGRTWQTYSVVGLIQWPVHFFFFFFDK